MGAAGSPQRLSAAARGGMGAGLRTRRVWRPLVVAKRDFRHLWKRMPGDAGVRLAANPLSPLPCSPLAHGQLAALSEELIQVPRELRLVKPEGRLAHQVPRHPVLHARHHADHLGVQNIFGKNVKRR